MEDFLCAWPGVAQLPVLDGVVVDAELFGDPVTLQSAFVSQVPHSLREGFLVCLNLFVAGAFDALQLVASCVTVIMYIS